jgi:glycolate oxidase iron-sulfur subunit
MTTTDSLLALADQCVKCGLCLPQCPTYALGLDENESPRGRIALIQAITSGNLQASGKLRSHLDHCLLCRRCERVCPSQVEYGKLVEQARTELAPLKPATPVMGRLGLWFIETPMRLALLRLLLRVYQRGGLQWLARHTGLLKRLGLDQAEARLPEINQSLKTPSPGPQSARGRIALFTGCTQSLFDSEAIRSCQRLLTRLGYEVVIPEAQVCCGALHNTQGYRDKSRHMLSRNAEVFADPGIDKVLYLSSGCGAFIDEHAQPASSLQQFQEVTDFLDQNRLLEKLAFKPLAKRVAVHLPCSQKNVLRQDNTALNLLQHIPAISLLNLEASGCCGAGASNMVRYPQLTARIRQPLLDSVVENACQLLVTTNPGCQLHLQQGFNVEQAAIQVLHPVTLLARQLEA